MLKWSIWWAFATCINFQVGNYIQPLWESILPFQSNETLYNGAVEATSTFLGMLVISKYIDKLNKLTFFPIKYNSMFSNLHLAHIDALQYCYRCCGCFLSWVLAS